MNGLFDMMQINEETTDTMNPNPILTLFRRPQLLILAALAALMLLTRTHNFMLGGILPDASWAIFLLGGFFLKRWSYIAMLGLLAWTIDLAVTINTPAAAYCFSPAYIALVACWPVLWGAGYLAARMFKGSFAWPKLLIAPVLGVSAAFLISNLGFYALSGNFEGMAMTEYASRVSRYFDGFLLTSVGYFLLGVALAPAVKGLVDRLQAAIQD